MNERFDEIIRLLRVNGRMSVKQLSESLYVCEMTIRRDLKALEQHGTVKRYNGGAMLVSNETELPIDDRRFLHSEEKTRLAKEAAKYVDDFSTVFIDCSSTCMYIIPQLSMKKGIKIITNSLPSVTLASQYHIPCILIGGDYYERDMCTVGSMASEQLSQINADIAFFSALAISDDGIISDSNERLTAVRRAVIKNCSKNVFIFTKTKMHKKMTYSLCHTEQVFKVIYE